MKNALTRMGFFAIMGLVCLIGLGELAPQKVGDIFYKADVIMLAAYGGYWIYRHAHGDGTRVEEMTATPCETTAMLCRAAFIIGTMLAAALIIA